MSQTNYDPSSSREGSTRGATTTHTRGLAKLGVREPYSEDR